MAYYTWNRLTPTDGDTTNQVYVDVNRKIFKYDASTGFWVDYKDVEFKKVKTFYSYCMGKASINPLNRIQEYQPSPVNVTWDSLWSTSFLEVVTDAVGAFYFKNMTYDEFNTWAIATLPIDPGTGFFQCNLRINIYDIFDSNYDFKHIAGHNSMYGVARGRHYYYNSGYHGTFRLPANMAGLDPNFHNTRWLDPLNNFGDTLVNSFNGSIPLSSTDNEMCIWFSRSKHLYHQPKVSSRVQTSGRISYNLTTRIYENCPDDSLFVGKPFVLSNTLGSTERILHLDAKILKNNFVLRNQSCIMIYPLVSPDGNHIAFLMKPLGIDTLDFKREALQPENLSSANIFSYTEFTSNYSEKCQLVTNLNASSSSAFASISSISKFPYGQKVNDPKMPKVIKFFNRDTVNGVRSYDSPTIVKSYVNKTNANLYFGMES
jgi:hypothetical protein